MAFLLKRKVNNHESIDKIVDNICLVDCPIDFTLLRVLSAVRALKTHSAPPEPTAPSLTVTLDIATETIPKLM